MLGFHGTSKVAHLTFDDGPSRYTGQLLDILAAAGVKATFCRIGSRLAGFTDVERRLIADGHTLCNHSWTHPDNIAALAPAQIDQQIGDTQHAVAQFNVTVRYFRAPAGDFGKNHHDAAAAVPAVPDPTRWAGRWTPRTGRNPASPTIVQTVLSTVEPGAVILLHDGGGNRTRPWPRCRGSSPGCRARATPSPRCHPTDRAEPATRFVDVAVGSDDRPERGRFATRRRGASSWP